MIFIASTYFQFNVVSQMAITQHNYVQKKLLFTEFLGFGAQLEKRCLFLLSTCDIHEN